MNKLSRIQRQARGPPNPRTISHNRNAIYTCMPGMTPSVTICVVASPGTECYQRHPQRARLHPHVAASGAPGLHHQLRIRNGYRGGRRHGRLGEGISC